MARNTTSFILLSILLCFAPSLATVVSQNLGSFVYQPDEQLQIPLGNYFSGSNLQYALNSSTNGSLSTVALVQAAANNVTVSINTTAYNNTTPVAGDFNNGLFVMIGSDFNLYTASIADTDTLVNFTVTSLASETYNNTLGYVCTDAIATFGKYTVGCTQPDATNKVFNDIVIFVDLGTLTPTPLALDAIPLVDGIAAAPLVVKFYKIFNNKFGIAYHVGSASLHLIDITNQAAKTVTMPSPIKAISSVEAAGGYLYISGDGLGIYQIATDGQNLVGDISLISNNPLTGPVSAGKTLFGLPYFAVAAQNESFILAGQATTDAFVLPWGNDTSVLNDVAFDDNYLYLISSRSDSSAQFLSIFERNTQGVVSNSLLKQDITSFGNTNFLGLFYGEDGGDVVLVYTDRVVFIDANDAALQVFHPVNQTQITVTANGTDGKSVSSTVTLIPRNTTDQTVLKVGSGNLVGNNGQLLLDNLQAQFNGPFLRVSSQGQLSPNVIGPKNFTDLSGDGFAYTQIYAKFVAREDLGYAGNDILSQTDYTSPVKLLAVNGTAITYELGFINENSLYNPASNTSALSNTTISNSYGPFTTITKCLTGVETDVCLVDGNLGVFNEYGYATDNSVTCSDIYVLSGQFYPAERAICVSDAAINVYNVKDDTSSAPKLTLVYTVTPAQLGLINFTNSSVSAHPSQNQILFIGYPLGIIAIKAPLFQTDSENIAYNPMIIFNQVVAFSSYKLVAGPKSLVVVSLSKKTIIEYDVSDVYTPFLKKTWVTLSSTILKSSAIKYEVATNQLFVAVNNTDATQSILILQPGNAASAYQLARINITNATSYTTFTTATDVSNGYSVIFSFNGQGLTYTARPQSVGLGVNGLTASQNCLYCSVKTGLSVYGAGNNYTNFTYTNIAAEKPIGLSIPATLGFSIANTVYKNSPSKMFSGNPLDYNVSLTFAKGITENPFKYFNYWTPLNYTASITPATFNSTNNQWVDTFTNKTHGFILLNDGLFVYNLTNTSQSSQESFPAGSLCISGETDDRFLNVVLFCLDSTQGNWFFFEIYTGIQVPVTEIPYKYRVVTPTNSTNFFIFTLGSNPECPITMIEVNSTAPTTTQSCPTDAFEFGITPLYFDAQVFDVAYDYDTTIGSFVVFVGDTQGNMASFIVLDSDNVQPFGLNNNFLSLIQSDIPPAQLQVKDLKVINVNTTTGVTSGQVVVVIKNFHSYSVSFSSGADNIISLTAVQSAFVAVPETPSTGSYAVSGSFFFDIQATPDLSSFYLVSYPFTNLAQTGPAKYKYIAPIQRVVMNTVTPSGGAQFPLAINGTGMPANVMVTVATQSGDNVVPFIQVYTAQDQFKVTASNAPTAFGDLQGKNPSLNVQVANEISTKPVGFALNYTGAGRLGVALSGIFAVLGAVFVGLMF